MANVHEDSVKEFNAVTQHFREFEIHAGYKGYRSCDGVLVGPRTFIIQFGNYWGECSGRG